MPRSVLRADGEVEEERMSVPVASDVDEPDDSVTVVGSHPSQAERPASAPSVRAGRVAGGFGVQVDHRLVIDGCPPPVENTVVVHRSGVGWQAGVDSGDHEKLGDEVGLGVDVARQLRRQPLCVGSLQLLVAGGHVGAAAQEIPQQDVIEMRFGPCDDQVEVV